MGFILYFIMKVLLFITLVIFTYNQAPTPDCDNKDATAMNAKACKCGNKDCTANNLCTASSNTCSTVSACTNTDGSTKLTGICLCGKSGCVNNDYCNSKADLCFKDCASKDSSAVN